MICQPDYLLGTCHDAQFTSFAPFFIHLNSGHRNSLPDGLKNKDRLGFRKHYDKQLLTNLRNLFCEIKKICNFFHKVLTSPTHPPAKGGGR